MERGRAGAGLAGAEDGRGRIERPDCSHGLCSTVSADGDPGEDLGELLKRMVPSTARAASW